MRITLNYGKKGLPLDLSDDWDVTVIRKRPMPIIADPIEAARSALSNPVGSRTLDEEAEGRRSACVLICDITRPVPNSVVLPVLVRELIDAGIGPEKITVLVATGLHRANEGDELRELVGDEWVLETVEVANHFARNDHDHVDLGTTKRGTRVRLDHRFVRAEVRIVTGLVEPHFMAGYSGGRKVVVPGVAHHETITSLHIAEVLEHPKSANCVLEGNPLHEEQLEILHRVGGALAVNTVIDEERRLSFVNFGEIEESHLAAAEFMQNYAVVPLSQKFKTVITSSAGYPLDRTYYQTVKGMVSGMEILETGGNLFIVSECSEGMGSPEYVAAQRRLIELGIDGFLEELWPKKYAEVDEWQTELQLRPMRIGKIHLYTEGLTESERALTGVHIVESLDEAIRKSVEDAGDKRVAVIPEGPYVVPVYKPASSFLAGTHRA